MIARINLISVLGSVLLATSLQAQGDTLTLDSCQAMAKRNYPLVGKYDLIQRSEEYSLDNASKGYLPHIVVNGQATYQSAVTQVPGDFPGAVQISKDQYKLYTEISQPITDLFTVKDQQSLVRANAQVEEQRLEVDLYALRERINDLFFGILLIDAQIEQVELSKQDIQTGIDRTEVAIENGVAIPSDADNLRAELLKTDQRVIELRGQRQAYTDMLSLFIGQTVDQNTCLEKPEPPTLNPTINRPELRLFDAQKTTLDIRNRFIFDRNLPRFSAFFQGGFGRPALNFLSNDFEPYFITGLRLNWNITSFYTANRDRQLIQVDKDGIGVQRDVFLFNTDLTVRHQSAEVMKLQQLKDSDEQIIALRESVVNSTQVQMQNGTANTNDYLIAVRAVSISRQLHQYHDIKLLMTQYALNNTTGN